MPGELEDAASSSERAVANLHAIVLPLSRPSWRRWRSSLSLAWNDSVPLIAVNRPEMFPLPVALACCAARTARTYADMPAPRWTRCRCCRHFIVANQRIVEASGSAVKG